LPTSIKKKKSNVQLLNVPVYAIEEAKDLPPDSILISIQEEHGEKAKLEHISCPTLVIQASDVETALTLENGNTLYPMSDTQVESILNFVDTHFQAKFCIVHCAAGVSRSASVVLGLHAVRDHALPKNFWKYSLPKPTIVGLFVLVDGKTTDNDSEYDAITCARSWRNK